MAWYFGYYVTIIRDIIAHYKNKNLDTAEFKKFTAECNTTSKCGYVASSRFKYVHDTIDKWQTPIETWHRRDEKNKMLGDCDDWARFFTHCLNVNGESATFLVMFDDKSGHATCRLKNETVGTFRRVVHKSSELETIASFWYPNWLRIRVYKQHGPEDGYRLECIKTFKRTIDEIQSMPRKRSQGVVLDEFVEMLLHIDPEAYIDLIEELIAEE